ncbi:transcriptional regulator [Streptomyces sp. NPDC048479]|uniref:transcriptional regulator n=1 Tax=Streptomyces sp. NPDC048479 TaxID=3154725 RepID=UPI003421F7B3
MQEEPMGFGELGAKGLEGGRALAASLDRRTFDDVAWVRSDEEHLQQAVKYLAAKTGAAAALQAHDITADPAALTAWRKGHRTPSPEEKQRLIPAFRDLRRRNIAPYLTRVLNADSGTRIEIHPVDQEVVETRHRRYLRVRLKNIYRWNAIGQAWAQQDFLLLEELWRDVISDMDSDYRKYEYVRHIGICG